MSLSSLMGSSSRLAAVRDRAAEGVAVVVPALGRDGPPDFLLVERGVFLAPLLLAPAVFLASGVVFADLAFETAPLERRGAFFLRVEPKSPSFSSSSSSFISSSDSESC